MALASLKEMGVDVLMNGRVGDNIFYYMDTKQLLGIILELIDTSSRLTLT